MNYNQVNGKVLEGSDLESKCGSKTYTKDGKVLVPCGYIANSFFNDVITVTTEGGANRLVKGEPETLRLLHRIHVWRGTKPDMLLGRIDGALQALH